MHRYYVILLAILAVIVLTFQTSCFSQNDSLADCFHFELGRQWIYHFHNTSWWEDLELPGGGQVDNEGTSRYTIIKQEYFLPDSMVWTFNQTRSYNSLAVITGVKNIDTSFTDSTTFTMVELTRGHHQIYLSKYEMYFPWDCAMPFIRNVRDSVIVNRYNYVDSSDRVLIHLKFNENYTELKAELSQFNGVEILFVQSTIYGPSGEYTTQKLISCITLDVGNSITNRLPVQYVLSQNYPNPFNPVTTISYSLPKSSFVYLNIYDVLGREIAAVINEQKPAGTYQVSVDGSKWASGVYFYRLTADNYNEMKKLILLR